MHCIQKYAHSCNASLSQPKLEPSFFPTPFDEYITIDLGAEFNNRSYAFFEEVIRELLPILQRNNIRIIQIGDPKDAPLEGVYYLNPQLNLNHTIYILSKSRLHLSSQSFSSNIANVLDVPQVLLYEANEKDICAPYWNRDLIKFILYKNSDRPSFGAPTKENNINKIKPEKIAIEVAAQLQLDYSEITTNTLHLGHLYHLKGLEVIPNFNAPNNLYANSVVNIRGDLAFSIPAIESWCSSGRKLAIKLPRVIDVNFLKHIKPHLQGIGYEVTIDSDPTLLKTLQSIGVPLKYITHETDSDKLKELRLKFLDFVIEQEIKATKKDLDLSSDIDYTKLNFKSSKKILHNNQMFESLAHALSGSQNNNIIDSSMFWEDLKFYKIYSNNG